MISYQVAHDQRLINWTEIQRKGKESEDPHLWEIRQQNLVLSLIRWTGFCSVLFFWKVWILCMTMHLCIYHHFPDWVMWIRPPRLHFQVQNGILNSVLATVGRQQYVLIVWLQQWWISRSVYLIKVHRVSEWHSFWARDFQTGLQAAM